MANYLFTSDRLGFRNWTMNDLDDLYEMNSTPQVMRHFPATQRREECEAFILRAQRHFQEHGFNYYAVDHLASQECIGFTGLARQTYTAPFTPCTDIGWRLKEAHWGHGYATEGAKACLLHAKHELGLNEIFAVAVKQNEASINVMRKIGMQYHGNFFHPALKDHPELAECVVYRIEI
ncbi:MAG: GNAT family N-acetyltransferase [Bacteroidota bacterium]